MVVITICCRVFYIFLNGNVGILDITGRQINLFSIENKDRLKLPLSLTPGTYFIRVVDDSQRSNTLKLIKNKI